MARGPNSSNAINIMSIKKDIRNIRSNVRELKQFGLTMSVATVFFGGLSWMKGHSNLMAPLLALSTILIITYLKPALLKPAQKVWMTMAIFMGWLMSRLLLSVIYFVMVTPIGLIYQLKDDHFRTPTKSKKNGFLLD